MLKSPFWTRRRVAYPRRSPLDRATVSDGSDLWHPVIHVAPGRVEISVGGGQPGFENNARRGGLTVEGAGSIDRAFACAA